MKVLYDHQCFAQQQYGGVSRYHYQLIKELSQVEDIEIKLSLKYSNNFYINEDKNFSVKKFFPNKNFYFKRTILDYINRISARKILEKGDYDIFHPTYYDPYFLKYLDNKPFVVTVYDTIHEKYPEIINSIDKTIKNKKVLLPEAQKILAISNSTKNDIIQLYKIPPDKIEVVYLAASINKNMAVSKEQLNLPEKYILYVGNRDFYKNFNNLLFAIEPILRDNSDIFLIAAGGGKFNAAETKLFESKKVNDKIIYKNADDKSLATLYSNALAFVFPSKYEGFGIPALEAMNCDCPVILSNTSSLPEVAGDAAIYFDPNDINDIKMRIESVIFNKELREDLIKKGMLQKNKFSFQKTALQTKEIYMSLLNR